MTEDDDKKNDLVSKEYQRNSDDDSDHSPTRKRSEPDDKRKASREHADKPIDEVSKEPVKRSGANEAKRDDERHDREGRFRRNSGSERERYPPRQRSPHRSGRRFDRERSPRRRSRSRERPRPAQADEKPEYRKEREGRQEKREGKDDSRSEDGDQDDDETKEKRGERGDHHRRSERPRFRDERPTSDRLGHERANSDRAPPGRRPFREDASRGSRRYDRDGDGYGRRHSRERGDRFPREREHALARVPPPPAYGGRGPVGGWDERSRPDERPRGANRGGQGEPRWQHDMYQTENAETKDSPPRGKFADLDARRKAQMEKLEAMLA